MYIFYKQVAPPGPVIQQLDMYIFYKQVAPLGLICENDVIPFSINRELYDIQDSVKFRLL